MLVIMIHNKNKLSTKIIQMFNFINQCLIVKNKIYFYNLKNSNFGQFIHQFNNFQALLQ